MLSRTKLIVFGIVIFAALIAFDQYRRRSNESHAIDQNSANMQMQTAAPNPEVDWKEFIAPNGSFKVLLPAMPQHATDAVPLSSGQGLIKYDMFLSQERDGTLYMISVIQYPKDFDVSDVAILLEGVMQEMVAGNSNNKMKRSSRGIFNQRQSLDFEIENSDVFIRCKTFIDGSTIYVFTMIDRDFKDLEKQFMMFTNSFQLLNPLSPVTPTPSPTTPAPTTPAKMEPVKQS